MFKLKEIQDKLHIIKKGDIILDLGSAPGSFIQYLSKIVGPKGFVLGIDIQKIDSINQKNTHLLQKDIVDIVPSDPDIIKVLPEKIRSFDVITADLAPMTSGIKDLDHERSIELNRKAFEIATWYLKPNGTIISKLFEGSDTQAFEQEIAPNFSILKRYKPKATRKKSKEWYLVAKKK